MSDYYTAIAEILGIPLWLLIIILLWALFWKILATWKAARKNSPIWFIALFVINTIGILELLYLYVFSELPKKPSKQKTKKKTLKKKK